MREIAERMLREERPEFFDDFWRRVQQRERATARRWRIAALALGLTLLVAFAAGVVVASPFGRSNVVDVSVDCLVQQAANFRGIDLATIATRMKDPSIGRPPEAQLLVSTGGYADTGTRLLQVDAALKGFLVNGSRCASSKKTAKPGPAEARLTDILHAGARYGKDYRCPGIGKVHLRARLTVGKNGIPSAAQVSVQKLATGKTLLYVDWRPSSVRVYLGSACEQTDIGF
jgi:hypothetical protein